MAEAALALKPGGRWSRRLLAGLGLLLLAGCQTIPRASTPVAQAPEPEAPAGDLPADQQRHRVALLVPTTGANAGVGQSLANAANLAILDTGGARLRVTTYDTATGAAAAAQRALADGNRLILGPLLAEDVSVVAPIARRANVPLISFSNDVSVAGNGVYLLGYNPAQAVERVVDYARTRGVTRFAGLVPTGAYGERAAQAYRATIQQSGGQLVGIQTYDRSARSINAAIARLATTSSYDALLIADSGGVALQAAPLVRRAGGATARILGTELWNTEQALAGNATLRGSWFASVSDGLYNQLATKYRARFGRAPYRLASLGYDSVLLVTRIARDWRPGSAFPTRALADSGGFSGIDGAFRFGANNVAERMLEVQQVDAGRFSVVSAAPGRFGARAGAR